MILAELQGKTPSKYNEMEDLLTSNVFSFFKYSNRQIFKDYLLLLGINVTLKESQEAEFIFWTTYEDRTEPDLIVICGKYYLLFEAKLYSDFSPKTKKSESQIDREVLMGKMMAKNINKEFVFIAITAEYYKNRLKYNQYENDDFQFIWTNWQFAARFLNKKLEESEFKQDRVFASDLFSLLVKKKLRSFEGLTGIKHKYSSNIIEILFYNFETSKYKGEFSGFIKNLSAFKPIPNYHRIYRKLFFTALNKFELSTNQTLFYNGK